MLALELLHAAAAELLSIRAPQIFSSLIRATDREVRWILDAGLGPLLLSAIGSERRQLAEGTLERLIAADLTARVRQGCLTNATVQVIEACETVNVVPTLLKGIAISRLYYAEEHHRPMSDVDILVPAEMYSEIESELIRNGFQRHVIERPPGSHHGTPLHDPARIVWIELHTELFPSSSGLLAGRSFSRSNIADQTISTTYHGRPINRITDELQLVYLAASWIRDLTINQITPSLLVALFDSVRLLRTANTVLDWAGMKRWLDNDLAITSLHVLLTYLAKHGLCELPPPTSPASNQTIVSRLELPIIHTVLDRHLLAARPWTSWLPPPVPGRYRLKTQVQKRLQRR